MMSGPLNPRQSLAVPFIWLKSTASIYSKRRFTQFHFASTLSKSRCKPGFRILTGVLIHRLSASVFACRKEMFCCFFFYFKLTYVLLDIAILELFPELNKVQLTFISKRYLVDIKLHISVSVMFCKRKCRFIYFLFQFSLL